MPGHHELFFRCEVPSIGGTGGSIPIVAWPDQRVRIAIEARAHLSGPDVRVRVWQNDALTLDEKFEPTPNALEMLPSRS